MNKAEIRAEDGTAVGQKTVGAAAEASSAGGVIEKNLTSALYP